MSPFWQTGNKIRQTTILAVLYAASVVWCRAQAGVVAAPVHSVVAPSPASADKTLPEVFAPVLPKIEEKSRIPILLPSHLPEPISGAKHADIEKASDKEYAITLYYGVGTGNVGFAALFSAEGDPNFDPQNLGNIPKAELSHGLRGYFRPVSCGGSCAPANIWWKDGRVLYQIQIEFPSNLGEGDQQRAITAAADSAIVAGPR